MNAPRKGTTTTALFLVFIKVLMNNKSYVMPTDKQLLDITKKDKASAYKINSFRKASTFRIIYFLSTLTQQAQFSREDARVGTCTNYKKHTCN